MSSSLEKSINWLKEKSNSMIRSSKKITKSGVAAFPPQVGSGYKAFWLRDYAYMLEGNLDIFTKKELKDSFKYFLNSQQKDGSMVDCVKFDGTPIFKPGYGTMGQKPVTDGSQFGIEVAFYTYKKTKDLQLIEEYIDNLDLAMKAVPRNIETGLVHIKPGEIWKRCPYGFTDTVRKQGDLLFSSLLYFQACSQISNIYSILNKKEEARFWKDTAKKVSQNINNIFWDKEKGLYRAATSKCNQPDIWGSAFAVYIGITDKEKTYSIANYFEDHYREIVLRGQIRHLPGRVYWEDTTTEKGEYQNGAYWATPTGWFVYSLNFIDEQLADKTIIDLVEDFKNRGVNEWVNENKVGVPDYIVSATLPLAGIYKMLSKRKK